MARPERNTVDYFPLYCEDGKKMFYIEETYGNDGFAVFVKILRELAKTEYHYLNLSDNKTLMFLSAKCKVNKEILLNIISDLAELGKFNLELWNDNKIIWCQDFIDSIQDAYKKRNNECINFEGLLTLLNGLGIRKRPKSASEGSVKPQRKEEEIKEKKSKLLNDILSLQIETNQKNNLSIIAEKINGSFSRVQELEEPLTAVQLIELINTYGWPRVETVLSSMHNKKDLLKKYVSAYKTANNWLKRDTVDNFKKETNGNNQTRAEKFRSESEKVTDRIYGNTGTDN